VSFTLKPLAESRVFAEVHSRFPLRPFALGTVQLAGDPGMAVAWAQLIFNLVVVFVVLVLLRIFYTSSGVSRCVRRKN